MENLTNTLKAKNIKDCIEIATVDAYDESEIATGWYNCLDEILCEIKEIKVLGFTVKFEKIDIDSMDSVVVLCKSGKNSAQISLVSVEWINLSKVQKLWIDAWKKYYGIKNKRN